MVEVKSTFDSKNITSPLVKLQMRKTRWFWIIFSLAIVFVGALYILFPAEGAESSGRSFGIFLAAVGILFYPIVFILTKGMQKLVNKSMKMMSAETLVCFRFEEEKVYEEDIKGEVMRSTSEVSYELFYKAYETKSHFFMYISMMQTWIIPKKDIVTGTPEEIAHILSGKLGKKFKVLNIK